MTDDELASTLTAMENAVGLLSLRRRGVNLAPEHTSDAFARYLLTAAVNLVDHYGSDQ